MKDFIYELKHKKIINKSDIIRLKSYIDKKYSNYTSANRASILSKTIHHILDMNLSQFDESERKRIKFYTLKNTFSKNKDSIFMYDIFNSCITIGNLKHNFIEELLNWLNSNITNKVKESYLRNYIKKNCISTDTTFNAKSPISKNNTIKNINIYIKHKIRNRKGIVILSIFTIFIFLYSFSQLLIKNNIIVNSSSPVYYAEKAGIYINNLYDFKDANNKYPNINLPYYMRYKEIRKSKLKIFLKNRNSILVKEPYFSTMLDTARKYNLNPLLLFAISGQEQNFVPQNEKYAIKIANNPFNVFHSWQEYNTNIIDSSEIAARTIINLSKDMPKNANPFLWIGKRYAEDKNWGYGVENIFKELEK